MKLQKKIPLPIVKSHGCFVDYTHTNLKCSLILCQLKSYQISNITWTKRYKEANTYSNVMYYAFYRPKIDPPSKKLKFIFMKAFDSAQVICVYSRTRCNFWLDTENHKKHTQLPF